MNTRGIVSTSRNRITRKVNSRADLYSLEDVHIGLKVLVVDEGNAIYILSNDDSTNPLSWIPLANDRRELQETSYKTLPKGVGEIRYLVNTPDASNSGCTLEITTHIPNSSGDTRKLYIEYGREYGEMNTALIDTYSKVGYNTWMFIFDLPMNDFATDHGEYILRFWLVEDDTILDPIELVGDSTTNNIYKVTLKAKDNIMPVVNCVPISVNLSGLNNLEVFSTYKLESIQYINFRGCCNIQWLYLTDTLIRELDISSSYKITRCYITRAPNLKQLPIFHPSYYSPAYNWGWISLEIIETGIEGTVDLRSFSAFISSIKIKNNSKITAILCPLADFGSVGNDRALTITGNVNLKYLNTGNFSRLNLYFNGSYSRSLEQFDISGSGDSARRIAFEADPFNPDFIKSTDDLIGWDTINKSTQLISVICKEANNFEHFEVPGNGADNLGRPYIYNCSELKTIDLSNINNFTGETPLYYAMWFNVNRKLESINSENLAIGNSVAVNLNNSTAFTTTALYEFLDGLSPAGACSILLKNTGCDDGTTTIVSDGNITHNDILAIASQKNVHTLALSAGDIIVPQQ